jgi:two-component system, NtrC family, nitrogen regulation sensor histidine kinase NtrY
MISRIKNIFKGRNKFFLLFFFTLVGIVAIGVVSPILQKKMKQNWEKELSKNILSIESSVSSLINEKINLLQSKSGQVKREFKFSIQSKKNINKIFHKINSERYYGYSIQLINNREELAAWTNFIAIPVEEFFPLSFAPGEIFFFRSDLTTYLSVIDTFYTGNNLFYYSISMPVEKHFEIQNSYYEKVNLTDYLSKKYSTEVTIYYSQFAEKSKDGRKFSVEIRNNKNHKIAVIDIDKPALDATVSAFNEDISDIQALLTILGVCFILLGFRKEYHKINIKTVKFLLLVLVIVLIRYLLYKLNFPSKFIDSPLNNSSYFASTFGGGIVKSPLEFFITVLLFLVICFNFYNLCLGYFNRNKNIHKGNIYSFLAALVVSIILYVVFLRGLGASLKSIIFDSSLRYFKEAGLLPNLPAAMMQLNTLLLGLSSVLVSVSILLLLIHFLPVNKSNQRLVKYFYTIIFIFFQVAGYLYDYFQKEPQGNDLIRFLFITFTFILAFKIYLEGKPNIYNYAYAALIASIITVSLLNFYNSKLERESLKTTATELTRPNDSWLEFMVTQTLINSSMLEESVKALKDRLTNYEASAFIIWSQSILQKEKLNSSIALLNRRKELLGSFGIDLDDKYRVNPSVLTFEGDNIKIFNNYRPAQLTGKIISGITPVKEEGVILGYIVASILYDESNYGRINYPKVLSPNVNSLNSTVDFEKLKIFDFTNGQLENVFGELVPPDEIVKEILNADFKNSEAWIKINIDNDNYITYILKYFKNKNERVLAVALKEINLSWSLYNFLKVFFIHMIFIVGFLAIIFAQQLYKAKNIKYSFRLQLLGAFLCISLFPLLLLAFYNRNLSDEKNIEATLINLKEKASNVDRFLEEKSAKTDVKDLKPLFGDASDELNINYSLYSGRKIIYSSNYEFYETGLLSRYLNPLVYTKFNALGFKEELANESMEKFSYDSYYKKIRLNNSDYILQVDDLFNKVSPPISGEDYDVFLFGSYSVVIILVVLFSTFLANRISSPIRKLTKATVSVAGGDLSLEVDSPHKGEVGALVKGFNQMIQKLKESQSELAEMERENAWKEMARQVAHEIKNPLTPMKLAVQQLVIAYKDKSNKFDSIFDKVSKTIIGQIDTLSNIASEFSSFARMPKLKLEKFNVLQTVDEAVNLFLEEKIEIEIYKSESDFQVYADKDQSKRTFINLIRNSIQAGANKVEIELGRNDTDIIIKIKDNGKGIPQDILPKVFEPNFTTKERGMGLGLKLSRKFLETINGKISIEETGQNGTTILIQIPGAK